MPKTKIKPSKTESIGMMLALIAVFSTYTYLFDKTLFTSAANKSGVVLSSNSGSSGDSDDNDDDSDEDSDEDDSDEDSDNDDDEIEDEREDQDSDENEDKPKTSSNSRSGSSSGKTNTLRVTPTSKITPTPFKTREVINNADGTTNQVRKELEDGKIKVEYRTFDANGNEISREKSESEGDKSETETKFMDPLTGKKISEVKIKTEDGKELTLESKGTTTKTKVKFNAVTNEIEISDKSKPSDDVTENSTSPELEIELESESTDQDDNSTKTKVNAEGDKFVITKNGFKVNSRFPIKIDAETGQIFVQTPNKTVELKNSPDVIVEKASASITEVESINVDNTNDTPTLVVSGTRLEKLLGLITVNINSKVTLNPETGEVIKTESPLMSRLLAFLSI